MKRLVITAILTLLSVFILVKEANCAKIVREKERQEHHEMILQSMFENLAKAPLEEQRAFLDASEILFKDNHGHKVFYPAYSDGQKEKYFNN